MESVSREEQLRRWLEEKKAAKEQMSSVKRGTRPPPSALQTPTTATSRRAQTRQPPPSGTAAQFSRFGAVETEQQTPVQGTRKHAAEPRGSELKTPTGRRTDAATAGREESSVDRRRAALQRTATASARKEPLASASKASARKQPEEGGSMSERRREAVARTGTGSAPVDMQTLQQQREQLALMEHVLLQWAYLTARAERAAAKQEQAAREQLRGVWGYVNEMRSRALAGSMEAVKQQQARQLQTQLQVQYDHLLPLASHVDQFVANYQQLTDSIASASHALPLAAGAAPADEAAIVAALQALDGRLAPPAAAASVVAVSSEVSRAAAVAKTELEALLKCRELLLALEMRLMQQRSIIIDQQSGSAV